MGAQVFAGTPTHYLQGWKPGVNIRSLPLPSCTLAFDAGSLTDHGICNFRQTGSSASDCHAPVSSAPGLQMCPDAFDFFQRW